MAVLYQSNSRVRQRLFAPIAELPKLNSHTAFKRCMSGARRRITSE